MRRQPSAKVTGALTVALLAASLLVGASTTGAGAAGAPTRAATATPAAGVVAAASTAPPSWALETVPRPPGARRALLTAVACPSSSWCVAVGYRASPAGDEHTLAEIRRGTWAIQSTPDRKGALASVLTAVSCASARSCVAVGSSTDTAERQSVLTEVWNGASWSIHDAPLPSGAGWSELGGVSCGPGPVCVAVGSDITAGGEQHALAEQWNGRVWRLLAARDVAGAAGTALHSVSCVSIKACSAVGYSARPDGAVVPLAERWNGIAFSVLPLPAPTGSASPPWAELDAVTCSSASSCVAVGDDAESAAKPFVALAETWNGGAVRLEHPPQPPGSTRSPLTGLGCDGPMSCEAVGYSAAGSKAVTLAEQWDGIAWHRQAPPDPGGTSSSDLAAVACRSATSCVAVGYAGNGGLDQPIAERLGA